MVLGVLVLSWRNDPPRLVNSLTILGNRSHGNCFSRLCYWWMSLGSERAMLPIRPAIIALAGAPSSWAGCNVSCVRIERACVATRP